MALSGTLDTFALPDVLRLLGSTQKTGRLRITGDRGSGSVWVDDGQVVATELTSLNSLAPTDIEVIFGLLRFLAGSFSFEVEVIAPNSGPPAAMEPTLNAAENMLAEWHAIEEVVTSLDVWVGLSPELEGPDVMIDAARWQCISAIGTGAQVGAVAEMLHLNEIDSCRIVKELVELGLVQLIDEPARVSAAPPAAAPIEEPIAPVSDDAVEAPVAVEAEPEFDEPLAADEPAEFDDPALDDPALDDPAESEPIPEPSTVPSLASLSPSGLAPSGRAPSGRPDAPAEQDTDLFAASDEADADGADLNPAEMARQLANLSPKAAKAVAAAAKASTLAERDAALAAVEAEDDTVNRGLLLKFLGSVDS